MADVLDFVRGVASEWRACVMNFGQIGSERKYGLEYELQRAKLDVERQRLHAWGKAVGLGYRPLDTPRPHARFQEDDVRAAVSRTLGCIQHIYRNPKPGREIKVVSSVNLAASGDDVPTGNSVFGRAYRLLRRSPGNRPWNPVTSETVTSVFPRMTELKSMVAEFKGFNDDLWHLFPDVGSEVSRFIRDEIGKIGEPRYLHLLQQAASEEYPDISETASARFGTLDGVSSTWLAQATTDVARATHESTKAGQNLGAFHRSSKNKEQKFSNALAAMELYFDKMDEGALKFVLLGPRPSSGKMAAHVYLSGGDENARPYLNDKDEGFVQARHASFGLYHRKKFSKSNQRWRHDGQTDEDNVFLDVESDPKYENNNPGTVTVEGFGLECWDHVRPQANTVTFSRGQLPEVEAEKLLRRTDELSHNSYEFGSDFALDEAYLKEFAGDLGNTSSIDDDFMTQYRFTRTPVTNGLASGRVRNICHLLNRDIFTDFKASPSIILTTWMSHTCRNMFLRQIIVARELALRLWYYSPHYLTSGDTRSFTSKALASLIIADLWFANVRHKAIDLNLPYAQDTPESREEQARAETVKCSLLPRKPQDPKEQARAEFLKCTADEALEKRRYGEAVDLYTESLNIDSFCTLAHAKKSAALLSQEKPAEALMNAIGATMADPRYAGGWVQRANINLKLGNAKKARNEYERAITVAGHGATDFMRRGLADANAKIDADLKAIESEPKKDTWHRLWTSYHDQDYDTSDKVICIYSLVDEQQVEGLLFFAQHMAWPYITETQDSIKTAYSLLRRGQSQPAQVTDWLLGLSLPGQWLAMNIMSTLIVCTPSIAGPLGVGHPSNCGISLPKQSHWRVRTVLGRVLSCLPGVTSLCGWVGPCPPIEFISLSMESKPRYILLKAPPVPPVEHTPDGECRAGKFFLHDPYDSTLYPKPGEDIRAFAAEMQDQNNWVIPERPNREFTACTMQAIRLEKLPLDSSIADKKANGEMTDEEAENNTGYRASIVFKMDNSDDPITYTLFNAPIFVTPPPCHSGPRGSHAVHLRNLERYQNNICPAKNLHDCQPGPDVLVINATGPGAELLARAWCAERGWNAIIRRGGGPCYPCAFRAASDAGLGVGVLIWVS